MDDDFGYQHGTSANDFKNIAYHEPSLAIEISVNKSKKQKKVINRSILGALTPEEVEAQTKAAFGAFEERERKEKEAKAERCEREAKLLEDILKKSGKLADKHTVSAVENK